MSSDGPSTDQAPKELVSIARAAIDAQLSCAVYRAPSLAAPWQASRGVFVTLRTRDGALRGCIGHVEPMHDTLAEEVASCAVSSALKDTRFAPVGIEELRELVIEVSVLGKPEVVATAAELEPRAYGVIVSAGVRRGVLLPDIEGVDSVEQQLKIALQKAGIDAGEAFRVERFAVLKVEEGAGASRVPDIGLH